MKSADRPKERVLILLDPDSWLIRDISKYADMVSPGIAVAQIAYYHGSNLARDLWSVLCEKNCEKHIDLVGVPCAISTIDMEKIVGLWQSYTLKIKDLLMTDEVFADEFKALSIQWSAEMFGYCMATAHVGIKHFERDDMALRDTQVTDLEYYARTVSLIHVGRAWFPKGHPSVAKWAHTEGAMFAVLGDQVWCKCNYTASKIIPWPIPPGTDFVSTKTLTIIHNSTLRFGDIPINEEFRQTVNLSTTYHRTLD